MTQSPKSPGRPRSKPGAPNVQQSIIRAAIPMFLQRGYEAVSMDDIARESGVTKASVYYYYPSKAELLTAAMVQMMESVARITQARLSEPRPLRERLLDIAVAHLRAIDFDLHSFMRKLESTMSAEQMALMRRAEQGIFDALEAAFSQAAGDGEIGPVQPRMTARAFVALLMTGHSRDAEGAPLFRSPQEAAEHIIGLLWHGLFPPAG
ncbi:TetR/AcrR family transcriptional regulator [Paenibacillus athensensis]|uniref:HTH tetR-type domain-containing protein n=1 Tax=Paenibacillus athensensis TaxID=1967502 RepID=A0A4Y8QBG5_9BACL|nr:TetR/AcrR family transcriptional regulator [Paenibacillus athensensis]MCD1259042.1 TetR/AcrR family transcriptional regulator [Paenibacillus athensensis]